MQELLTYHFFSQYFYEHHSRWQVWFIFIAWGFHVTLCLFILVYHETLTIWWDQNSIQRISGGWRAKSLIRRMHVSYELENIYEHESTVFEMYACDTGEAGMNWQLPPLRRAWFWQRHCGWSPKWEQQPSVNSRVIHKAIDKEDLPKFFYSFGCNKYYESDFFVIGHLVIDELDGLDSLEHST